MQLPGHRAGLIVAISVVGAVVGAAVLTVLVLARPAGTALTTAMPAAGASVGTPPDAVSLTFSDTVTQAHVAISGTVTDGEPAISGPNVTQPVNIAAGGRYIVVYHVVTQDGSSLSGTTSFTVAGPGISAGPDPAPPPELPVSHHGSGTLDALTAVVIGVNVLAMLVLGVLFVRNGRRSRPLRRLPAQPPNQFLTGSHASATTRE